MDIGFGECWQNLVIWFLICLFIVCEVGNLEKLLKELLFVINYILWLCLLEGKIKYKDFEINVIFFGIFFFVVFVRVVELI